MTAVTMQAQTLRAAIAANRPALVAILERYGARNPQLFGSVARGDAVPGSDIDLLVELDPGGGNPLLQVAGIGEEFSRILGVKVDVVTPSLLREPVSVTVRRDLVDL